MITIFLSLLGLAVSVAQAIQFTILYRDSKRFLREKAGTVQDETLSNLQEDTKANQLKYLVIFWFLALCLLIDLFEQWK